MRILMVAACPLPWPRGTPIRIRRLAESLVKAGHEVEVATYHLGRRDQETQGVRVHRIEDVPGYTKTAPGPTVGKILRLDPRLRRLVTGLTRSRRFDLIHAHHYEGLWAAGGAPAGTPVIYDAHTTLAGELPDYRLPAPRFVLRTLGAWADARLPRRAQAVVAVSESIRDTLIRLGAAGHVVVIPNGVDWELFADLDGTPKASEVVMFTGNLAAYQGIDLLLRAFARTLSLRPSARLAIVTDGAFDPYEPLAVRLGIRDSVDIVRAPFNEQPRLLREARVAVSPRRVCDGVPQKLLNYMASGAAVVAFEGSAAHIEDGRTGRRIPDGDVDEMGRVIADLLRQPERAQALGRAARSEIQAGYTWGRMADRLVRFYEAVLRARKTGVTELSSAVT
ncbi:MAG: glycosyltransferase family 4 protein [Gemmatimonadetes bacterium]|nr:glycosyltransferase family 4 protein [Gemmatimonadota bacterium]